MQKTDGTWNRKMIKAVIFDMDNTLFDFVEAKLKACQTITNCLNIKDDVSGEKLLSYFLRKKHGFEDIENIADYMKDRNVYEKKKFEECCKIYEKVKLNTIKPYPNTKETLEKLKNMGLKLAVVTDAKNGHATARLKKTNLFNLFDAIISIEMTGKKKPEPDSIKLALKKLRVDTKNAILIGDSLRRDIEAGNKLGMITVYAAYGDRNFQEEKTTKADFTLKYSITEILEVLEKLN